MLIYYIWCEKEKLWKKNHMNNAQLHNEISLIIQRIAFRAFSQNIINKQQYRRLKDRSQNGKWFNGIKRFFYINPDHEFDCQLNIMHPYLPIARGKKINMQTLEISERTKNDYWTFEFPHRFIPNQPLKENKFAEFLQQMFPDRDEYCHMVKILGYMVTTLNNENMFLMIQSRWGGSGKTTLMELFTAVFPQFCCEIQRDVLLHGKGNLGAEYSKLIGKRVAWMDEGTPLSFKKKIDITNILKLTGGGSQGFRDCRQQGGSVRMYEITAKLVAMGNKFAFNTENQEPLDRRVILALVKTWFRSKNGNKPNPNCPYLRLKIPGLKHKLLQYKDHIFTFIVCAANHYLKSNVNLVADQPESWKKAWELNNMHSDYEQSFIIQNFINDKCTRGDPRTHNIKASKFRVQLMQYARTNHGYTDRITSTSIEKYFINSKANNLSYCYHPRRMIKGISYNENNSIFLDALNNDPQF